LNLPVIARSLFVSCLLPLLAACGGGGVSEPVVSQPVDAAPKPATVSTPISVPTPAALVALDQLTILVVGQSISSNCNEHKFGPVDNVFQIGRDGSIKVAQDPFEWADCSNGSMWMPLGKRLIDGGLAKKVVFMPIGVGGSKVSDWQEGGTAYAKLNSVFGLIKDKGLHFDLALWHQGSSDIGTDPINYYDRLTDVVNNIDAHAAIGKWIVALHSRCNGSYDQKIEDTQKSFATLASTNHYLGPNNNLLGNEYRIDGCHLNQAGQEIMASMWYDSIKNALSRK
jgi:hypothetical protein